MTYHPSIHHRKSIRLKGYDYSQAGLYFFTICVHNRARLFVQIMRANNQSAMKNSPNHPSFQMMLNDAGQIANQCWLDIPKHFPNVVLHEHIIMPDHIHGIIEIVGANQHSTDILSKDIHSVQSIVKGAKNFSPQPSQSTRQSPSRTVGSIVRGYKIGVTKWFRANGNMEKIWQRDYWEHIIRDEQSYQCITEYIINNPKKWGRGERRG